MWIREERKPGTIRCERSGPWQADEQRFQPKWCSSSPTFGIGSLVDDPSLLGVDDGEEVGRLDARAFVQAGEVEELLRRRLQRLLGRAVERGGLVVLRVHGCSFHVAAGPPRGRGARVRPLLSSSSGAISAAARAAPSASTGR